MSLSVSAAMERSYDPLRIWVGSLLPGLSRTMFAEALRHHGVVCGDMTIFHRNGGVDTAAVIELRSEHEAVHALSVLDGLIEPRMGNPWRPIKARFAYQRGTAGATGNMNLASKSAGQPIITLPKAIPPKAPDPLQHHSAWAPAVQIPPPIGSPSASATDPRPARKRAHAKDD